MRIRSPGPRDCFHSPAPTPAPATSSDIALLATLKAMETRLVAIEKNDSGGGGSGRNLLYEKYCRSNEFFHNQQAKLRNKLPDVKHCRHCGKFHLGTPDSEYWSLEANSHCHPSTWKKKDKYDGGERN